MTIFLRRIASFITPTSEPIPMRRKVSACYLGMVVVPVAFS
jgi:hypothetical protein